MEFSDLPNHLFLALVGPRDLLRHGEAFNQEIDKPDRNKELVADKNPLDMSHLMLRLLSGDLIVELDGLDHGHTDGESHRSFHTTGHIVDESGHDRITIDISKFPENKKATEAAIMFLQTCRDNHLDRTPVRKAEKTYLQRASAMVEALNA